MKKILSLIILLFLALGMQAETDNPKLDSRVQQKFAKQISQCYFVTGDYWQLERLCNEKADSICDPMLAWARGMASARFLQLEEAKKHLRRYVYDYRYKMPEQWMLNAANELSLCLGWLQEYDEAAKVADIALQYISDEDIADEHQGAILRFTEIRDSNLEFAKHAPMTLSCSESGIRIPFCMKTFGKGKEKNMLVTIDGVLHGKSVSMVFDTGSGQNVITKEMAEELHLKPINAGATIDGAGESDASFVMADSLRIGNVMLRNVVFAMLDANNDELSQVTSVLIGMPVMLQMRQFTMDFKKKVITSPLQPTDYPDKNLTFHTDGGNFDVRIFHDGKPVHMKVDTGNGHLSHLDYQFYAENQEVLDRCKEGSVAYMGVGGVFEKRFAFAKKFDFMLNDKQYRFPLLMVMKDQMEAALGDNNMGLPFLSSFKRVTISLKDAHIEFE